MIITKNAVEQIRVEKRVFPKRTFVDVRTFYLLDGEWTATRKGCTVPIDQAEAVAAAIVKEATQSAKKQTKRAA
jgi:hypothetical protein